MKPVIAMASLIVVASTASATEKLNYVSCIYFHRSASWEYYGYQSAGEKFDLKEGESQMLVGAWTSERLPNYAICNEITGTSDNNLVRMRQIKFEGQIIDGIFDGCVAKGTDVKQTSEQNMDLARGSYSVIESEWLVSPAPDKIKVKTYIPTVDEINRLNEIVDKKCLELMP